MKLVDLIAAQIAQERPELLHGTARNDREALRRAVTGVASFAAKQEYDGQDERDALEARLTEEDAAINPIAGVVVDPEAAGYWAAWGHRRIKVEAGDFDEREPYVVIFTDSEGALDYNDLAPFVASALGPRPTHAAGIRDYEKALDTLVRHIKCNFIQGDDLAPFLDGVRESIK
jgi:hypothetical protein